ncbi:hypothetical protein CEXT_700341 [Caerostris extrusa]|uniref:Uncharacterized protein n=1 Tax=Caerostris extrusa TaxID=172846 RepID=A0AAV4RQ56_CAEEX|nr:hypothetical protein CEXT_700341 [Caerostris extrusa]
MHTHHMTKQSPDSLNYSRQRHIKFDRCSITIKQAFSVPNRKEIVAMSCVKQTARKNMDMKLPANSWLPRLHERVPHIPVELKVPSL